MNHDKRGETRSETARDNDDSELIDRTETTPGQQGRSGGDLQTDIGTQASEERVRDPEAREGVTKDDKIAHGTQEPGSNIQGSSDG